MRLLSSPLGRLGAHYDVIVVGSGYGGAVTAARLAGARWNRGGRGRRGRELRIAILERGEEILPGEFPRHVGGVLRRTRLQVRGRSFGGDGRLFDLRVDRDMSVLTGSGLGGTSLINANVVLAPSEAVRKAREWPSELKFADDDEWTPRFDRVREWLGAASYPDPTLRTPQVSQAADDLWALDGFPEVDLTYHDHTTPQGDATHLPPRGDTDVQEHGTPPGEIDVFEDTTLEDSETRSSTAKASRGVPRSAGDPRRWPRLPKLLALDRAGRSLGAGAPEPDHGEDDAQDWQTKAMFAHTILAPDGPTDPIDRVAESPQGHPPLAIDSPDIAVSFRPSISRGGIRQRPCTLCGDCVTGCNYSAKNTLPMNYLAAARQRGVEIFCGASVRRVERTSSGRWLLWVDPLDTGRERYGAPPMFVTADVVVLAAGSLGSTEILLRSSRRHGGELDLSPRLGEGFSGNGDVIAFGYNNPDEVAGFGAGFRAPELTTVPGPTITGLIDLRRASDSADTDRELIVEEGAIPGSISLPIRFMMSVFGLVDGVPTRAGWKARLGEVWRALVSLVLGVRRGALRNTQTYLVNGHDAGGPIAGLGRLLLHDGRLRIDWPWVASKTVFHDIDALLRRCTAALGGIHLPNPMWSVRGRRRLLTVHPLGGCRMAESADQGVVDHGGAVFDPSSGSDAVHEGLYVSDGSIVPRSLGANPLLTISALADRNAEQMARDWGWDVAAEDDFEEEPPGLCAQPGLRFSERMKGWIRPVDRAPWVLKGGGLELVLTIEGADLWRMCKDGRYRASAYGTARWPCMCGDAPITVVGTFQLFDPDPRRVETVKMRYELEMRLPDAAGDGPVYRFSGRKTIHDDRGLLDIWRDTTRMRFDLYDPAESDEPLANGTVTIGLRDVWHLLRSIRVTRSTSLRERIVGPLRFTSFFARTLIRHYGWILRPPDVANPYDPYDGMPALRESAKDVPDDVGDLETIDRPGVRLLGSDNGTVSVQTADGAVVTLTRHRHDGGRRGPVILAPGFGTSTIAFTIPTNDISPSDRRSFTDFLVRRGYDVWLFDYRASELSAAAGTQFTLDDIAAYDWPAAVETVMRIRRAEDGGSDPTRSVQILGHCVGSMSLLMSLLGGHLDRAVRSVICSQSLTHIDQPPTNRIKARLRLATLLHAVGGWPTYNPDFDLRAGWMNRMVDVPLRLLPWERCRNPVCRRIQFLYGSVNRHEQLNARTHDAMHEMFNEANKTTFEHLSQLILAGRLISADGDDIYITSQGAARMRLPVSLLQGEANPIFRPGGLERSHSWLVRAARREVGPSPGRDLEWDATGDSDNGLFHKVVLSGTKVGEDRATRDRYGHMDCFIGRDCWTGTFPEILEELQRGDRVARKLAGVDDSVPSWSVSSPLSV